MMKRPSFSCSYAFLSTLLVFVCISHEVCAFSIANKGAPRASSLHAQPPAKRIIPTKSKLTPAQRLRIANAQGADGISSSNLDQVKSMFYSFSDGIASIVPNGKYSNPDPIVNGYSINKKESKSANRQNFAPWMPNVAVPATPPPDASPFDTFKSTIYSTIDWVAAQKEKSSPSSTALNVPISPRDSAPSTANKSPFDVYNEFKESVYSTQDRLTQLIQSDLPSTLRSAQQTATEVKEGFVSLPNRISTTAQTISQIPQKVENQIFSVQGAIQERQQQVQVAQEQVQNLPRALQETLAQVQDMLENMQQTILNLYTSLRVLLGLEAPTPQPPTTKPPAQQNVAFALLVSMLQTLLALTGRLLAWLGPQMQAAFEKAKDAAAAASRSPQDAPDTTTLLMQSLDASRARAVLDTTDLDREIAAALALAEEALSPSAATEPAMVSEASPLGDLDQEIAAALALAEEALAAADETPKDTGMLE